MGGPLPVTWLVYFVVCYKVAASFFLQVFDFHLKTLIDNNMLDENGVEFKKSTAVPLLKNTL